MVARKTLERMARALYEADRLEKEYEGKRAVYSVAVQLQKQLGIKGDALLAQAANLMQYGGNPNETNNSSKQKPGGEDPGSEG